MISDEYAAGFFDGEGCVNITVGGKSRQVALRVMIVNTDEAILQAFMLRFGGRLSRPRTLTAGWKKFICLTLSGECAFKFLSTICRYAILKRPQIELGMEFWEFQHSADRCIVVALGPAHTKGVRPFRRVRRPETVSKELAYKDMMHQFNKKGAA